jgi:hypothetical protein
VPSPFWSLEVEDPVANRAWALTHWEKIGVKWALNKPAVLSVATIGGTALDVSLVERRTDLVLYRAGIAHHRGRLMKVSDDLSERGHVVNLTTIDYSGMLEHRFLQPDDRTTKVVLANPERTVDWEPTVQWKAGTVVADTSEPVTAQLFEALVDVPSTRVKEWSLTGGYTTDDLVVFENKIYRAASDVASIREWSSSSYKLGDQVIYEGVIYDAIGASTAPDWDATGGPDRNGRYPVNSFVYFVGVGGGAKRGLYRARRLTTAGESPATTVAWELIDTRYDTQTSWAAGTFVLHAGDVYYASNRIGEDKGRPDEKEGRWAGWVKIGIKGTNQNHLPSVAGNYWRPVSVADRVPGTPTSWWQDFTPSKPSDDIMNTNPKWKRVANDSYMARQYQQVGQFDIGWDLIAMTQAKLDGNLGISRATDPAGAWPSGRLRDRTFAEVSQTIADLVSDAGRATDGFEWWVDADRRWHAQTPMRWRDQTSELALVYGATIDAASRSGSGAYFSSATVEGDRKETVAESFERPSPIHGRWEIHERENDVKKQSTLRERADQYLDNANLEASFWKMDLTPGVYARSDIRLGDLVAFQVDFPPRLDLTGLVRIVEIDLTLTGDGAVDVVLGCQTVLADADQNGRTPSNALTINRVDEITGLSDTIARLAARIRGGG